MEAGTPGTGAEHGGTWAEGLAQLTAAAAHLEQAAIAIETRFAAGIGSLEGEVPKVVATSEGDSSVRLVELETKLLAAEQRIAELAAQAGEAVAGGRKTLPSLAAHMLAKHGIDTLDQGNGGALDAALNSLSLEQRIAVKSQLIRAGLLG